MLIEMKKLRELQNGSEPALDWFIHRYMGYVCTIIYNIIGGAMDTADVEEVASDVFFALWQNAGKICPGHVQGYLAVIARNKAKNKCREQLHQLPLEDHTITVDHVDPEHMLQQKELSQAVKNAVLDMPDTEREIFLRLYFYYQTIDQIADIMKMNASTVKTKLRRGRESLKKSLINYYQ